MRKGLRSITRLGLMVLLTGVMLRTTPDSSGRDDQLTGCLALGIDPNRHDTGPGEINYSLASPDGTYVVTTGRPSDHGCVWVTIYQCQKRQASQIGCGGNGFPGESNDSVTADHWVSEDELSIQRNQTVSVIDVRDYFTLKIMQPSDDDRTLGTSPDGQWIIFSSARDGMPELYREHPDGSDTLRLTYSLEEKTYYGWTPDNQWIVLDYASPDPDLSHAYLMHSDGSDLHPLSSTPINGTVVGLTPNRRWLLVQEYEPGMAYYRVSIPDGTITRLTDPASSYNFQAWSPDGRALVWMWTGQGENRAFDLIDLDTLQISRVFMNTFPEFRGWTKDGEGVLFTVLATNQPSLKWMRVRLDGSQVKEIQPPSP